MYEYLTEGGITRFTAVFSRVPEVVGPVNSGRPISLKLARHYRGMLFMSDLSRGSTARLTTDPVPTSLDVPDTFYRSANRPAQDNLFVTGTAMEKALYLGGKHAGGRWSTSDRHDPLRFSLDDGTSVGVADGLTWIDVVTG